MPSMRIRRPVVPSSRLTPSRFHTRYYQSGTGLQAANWLFNQAKQLAAPNPAITVQRFNHTRFQQPSIIARLPGNSSSLVVVGAHLDSIGSSPTGRSPGADDDGSGTVVVLEALRVLAASGLRPRNTIEFHWYAAEECGYGCSDHASARANGFREFSFYPWRSVVLSAAAAAFVAEDTFENSNKYIHSANDTYDKIMWPTILLHAKMVVSYLLEASYI
ncbi:putative leucine aminopeptidase [Metarhizium anisopliae]|nr:putative leucine aminopeptidase [Metarhizium anisopliae]